MRTVIIERVADPLPGGRAQLVETMFEREGDGAPTQVYSVRRGSPARAEVVAREVELLTMDDDGVHRTRREV
jgi:hypothetical protein